ncbi:hypothetical protein [Herbidospora sp. NBRC 101105]|uniref:hypothetical protein n=1 Tax=Herbidospora sp. NBRC 101105 TaxID=3032195 RepID=UPI0024A4057C|nr:hypothetical protein [Herbidospora sp. NBRC 101105]GLX97162.1 lipoprotein [Herbidospora sp. NBRC 101105]
MNRYGAPAWHLAALIVCYAVALYVFTRIISAGIVLGFVVWFVGAVILHDFIVLPLYSLADTRLQRGLRRRPPVNYVRVPAALSVLLLLIWFPLILRSSEYYYRAATGLSTEPYLLRWVLISCALFAGSAIVYALRRRSRR